MTDTKNLKRYYRDQIAQALDDINHQIDLCPHHYPLTPEKRAEWAAFPAQARSHPFSTIKIDPYHPLADYMRSGRIGPNYWPFASAEKAVNECK